MSYGKRRLSVLLSILIVLTTVFVEKPETQLLAAEIGIEAKEESPFYGLDGGAVAISYEFGGYFTEDEEFEVQKGMKDLYMGDYLYASNSGGERTLSYLKGATYKSNKTSVIKINKKTGKMEAKKTGTAAITVTYSGESRSFKVKVVKSTSKYKPQGNQQGWNDKNAQKLIKAYGNGITEKNRYKLLNIFQDICQGSTEVWPGIGSIRSGNTWKSGLYSSVQARGYGIYREIVAYGDARSPITTPNSKSFSIQKLSGKGKTITATLKKNVTTEDIFGVQYSDSKLWNGTKATRKDGKTATFTMSVLDQKENRYYAATATVTKGSKMMTIQLKDTSLKKGRIYKIPMFWAEKSKVTTFKAK